MTVQVLKPGLLTSVQDGGRPGHAAFGVGRAGAMDGPAWQLANALVGNRAGEAALECTLLGPTLRFVHAAVIALTGAPIEARLDGESLPLWTTCVVPAGSVLQLGGMAQGCRSYLALRGGIDVPLQLGSRSDDLHGGIGHVGGRALRGGDMLAIGTAPALPCLPAATALRTPGWCLDPQPWFDFAAAPLALLRGSHWCCLDADSRGRLHGAHFRVSRDANRTASRLDGQTLRLDAPLELVSEGVLPGTVQLPPSGQPIVLLAEAPVTGGYPRIGQLAAVELPRLAQRRPGDVVCFRETTLDEALQRLASQQQRLHALLLRIAQRLEQA